MRRLVVFSLLALSVVGCNFRNEKGGSRAPLEGEAVFPWLVQNVIGPKCMRCHSGATPAKGVDLTTHERMLATGSVIPGNPEGSTFYTEIKSGDMPAPKGSNPLPATEVNIIREWIAKGALPGAVPIPPPPPPPPVKPEPTYAWLKKNIFEPRCVHCHNADKTEGSTDLSTLDALVSSSGLFTKPLAPGDPEGSGIYTLTENKEMPKEDDRKLNTAELKALFDWIEDGAKP